MQGRLTEAGKKKLQSNLQKAVSTRALVLAQQERDYDKRGNGVNVTLDNALVGDLDAPHELTKERPHHRRFLDLTIQGYIPSEIASLTGFSLHTVSNTLKQPWARQYLIEQSKKTVVDEMKNFLEAEVLPSLQTLKAVRDGEQVNPMTRVAASNAILDRFLGKPVQPMTSATKPPVEMSDAELREQVAKELASSQPN